MSKFQFDLILGGPGAGLTAVSVFKNGREKPWDATVKEPVPRLIRMFVPDWALSPPFIPTRLTAPGLAPRMIRPGVDKESLSGWYASKLLSYLFIYLFTYLVTFLALLVDCRVTVLQNKLLVIGMNKTPTYTHFTTEICLKSWRFDR